MNQKRGERAEKVKGSCFNFQAPKIPKQQYNDLVFWHTGLGHWTLDTGHWTLDSPTAERSEEGGEGKVP